MKLAHPALVVDAGPDTGAAAPVAGPHLVRFYDGDGALADAVAGFFEGAPAALVVATPAHVALLKSRLGGHPAVTYLDAEATLGTFHRDGRLDEAEFRQAVGGAVRQAGGGLGVPRVFGEMVALLAARGDLDGAVELERMWNRLAAEERFGLLCAYPIGLFSGPVGARIEEVLAVHDPAHGADLEGKPRGRLVAGLQRQVASLESEVAAGRAMQAAIARIGHEALSGRSLPQLLDLVAQEVAAAVGADFCKVLELNAVGDAFRLAAGVGWRDGLVGRTMVPGGARSQGGYTLQSDHPVVVADLGKETRFEVPELLRDHGVVSGMTVIVRGRDRPYGVVGAHTRSRRDFSPHDVNFLQSVGHLLAAAIERQAIEEELRRHRDHLEDLVAERTHRLAESNHELEAFNYSVSHDLRTPLRAIAGFSGLLAARHGGELSPPAHRLLDHVQEEAVRMGTLIEELLNLSRYHRMHLAHEEVDLSRLCEEVAARLAMSAPGRRVACSVQPGIVARGDPHLLRVVLENLLGNAWKFTGRTEAPRVEVTAPPNPTGGVTVCVRDNGAGFDMAYAQKLFQPFQRLHSPSEFEGTGIGLATVARIVSRHGGKAWGEGRPGGGASFYFSLPP